MQLERRQRRMLRLGLTPLIDVVFLLLLFFMLSSTFLTLEQIEVGARPSGAATPGRDEVVVVDLAPSGLRIGAEAIAPERLVAVLDERVAGDRTRPIFIRPAGEVPLQRLIEVLEIIAQAGFADLSLQDRP